ncbi:nitroreductase family protein [Chloroflexota bacterium]
MSRCKAFSGRHEDMESFIEAIEKRVSVRTYTEQAVEEEQRQQILSLLSANNTGLFGNVIRFELINFSEMERGEVRKLGTYGFIKGAKMYIVCATKGGPGAMEDVGFCFEKIILGAINLGLGTCWLGGTFRRAGFARRLGISDDEVVPVISPLGYAHRKRRLSESVLRHFVKSDRRKPWEELFFDVNIKTPLTRDNSGKYIAPLECVRLGPSASNKQPWRIIRQRDPAIFRFYLRRNKGYGMAYEGVDLQRIDMGIALCHFELAARETGITGNWEVEEPDIHPGKLQYILSWRGT